MAVYGLGELILNAVKSKTIVNFLSLVCQYRVKYQSVEVYIGPIGLI